MSVVEIPLIENFSNSKLYDRALWCFNNTITGAFPFFLACETLELGIALEKFQGRKMQLDIDSYTRNVIGPDWQTLGSSLDPANDFEILEWIGLAIHESPR